MEQDVFQFVKTFVSIIWEAFPFVVLGAIISGALEELVPQQAIAKLMPKNKFLAIAMGAVIGLVFPMCECGVVPIMRRLLRKGLPLGTCVSYMMAGPIINPIVIAATWFAFRPHGIGVQIVSLRVGLGFVVATITAFIVQAQYRKYGKSLLTPLAMPEVEAGESQEKLDYGPLKNSASQETATLKRPREPRPLFQRLSNIAETSLHDFVDIMVFLTLGACIAGVVKVWGPTAADVQSLSEGYPALTILSMMVMAILMCLCSEADAFVAASFTTLHPSAKVAYLVLGPMFDFKLLMMFTRVFRRRIIVTIFISVFVQVFIYSMIVYYLSPKIFPAPGQ